VTAPTELVDAGVETNRPHFGRGVQTGHVNRQWRVERLLQPGEIVGPEHFRWHEAAVPAPAAGQFLVRTLCLSAGAAQRGYVSAVRRSQFLPGLSPGDVMRGRGVGIVTASHHPDFSSGDLYVGSLGWQDWSVHTPRPDDFVFSAKRIQDPVYPLTTELGTVGNAGMTAWFGLCEVGQFRAGESVLVSAAAGGVGSVVGQIARIRGAARVVGLAGTAAKCRWLVEELGYTHAINYREEPLGERLRALFPSGIDVFFDNVGGAVLETALEHLAMHARVVICGWISADYAGEIPPGPATYRQLLYKRARMEGFVVFDYWKRYPEAERVMKQWLREGKLRNCEDVSEGLETMPDALRSLFAGTNRGIRNVRVAPDPAPGSG
jgi:NADPH-dependent curcumin reductase